MTTRKQALNSTWSWWTRKNRFSQRSRTAPQEKPSCASRRRCCSTLEKRGSALALGKSRVSKDFGKPRRPRLVEPLLERTALIGPAVLIVGRRNVATNALRSCTKLPRYFGRGQASSADGFGALRLVLFVIMDTQPLLARADLLAAKRMHQRSWQVKHCRCTNQDSVIY